MTKQNAKKLVYNYLIDWIEASCEFYLPGDLSSNIDGKLRPAKDREKILAAVLTVKSELMAKSEGVIL